MSKIIINGKSDGSLKAYCNGNEVNGVMAGGSRSYTRMETGTAPAPPAGPKYLCFEPVEDSTTISMRSIGSPGFTPTIYISGDAENWTLWDLTPVTVNAGSKLYMYGENDRFSTSISAYWKFNLTYGLVAASGDLTTLLTKNGTDTFTTAFTFNGLFNGCTSLTTAPELPATNFGGQSPYFNMFNGCTSLTTAPELPATTIVYGCYESMFYGCTSLTTAPSVLPATVLKESCYRSMFNGCTSLTTPPELSGTRTESYCCQSMFRGCTSLTTAPELPATTLATRCYESMFYDCTSLTTAPSVLPATTLRNYCYEDMFRNCTSLTTAPELQGTALAWNSYTDMFNGCTNLDSVKMAVTTWNTDGAYNWLYGASPTGTVYAPTGSDIANYSDNASGVPTEWTVSYY